MALQTAETFTIRPAEAIRETPVPVETKEKEVEQPSLEKIREFAQEISEELKGVPLKQALANLMVGSLTEIERGVKERKDRDATADRAKRVLAFFEPFYGSEWRAVKSGFLGEVATTITGEEMGFVVKAPSAEDDLIGKIDLWFDENEGDDGNIYAIQVKTSAQIKEIELHRIDPGKEGLGVPEGYRNTARAMVKYTAEGKEFDDKNIVHLVLELPGGEGNENAVYSQFTGAPLEKMINTVSDKFYMEVWDDE